MSKKKRKKQVANQINYKEQAIDDCIEKCDLYHYDYDYYGNFFEIITSQDRWKIKFDSGTYNPEQKVKLFHLNKYGRCHYHLQTPYTMSVEYAFELIINHEQYAKKFGYFNVKRQKNNKNNRSNQTGGNTHENLLLENNSSYK